MRVFVKLDGSQHHCNGSQHHCGCAYAAQVGRHTTTCQPMLEPPSGRKQLDHAAQRAHALICSLCEFAVLQLGRVARQYARANVHAPWGATSGRRGPRGTPSSHYADLGRMIRLPCSIRRMQTRTNVHLWCRFKEVSTLSKTRAYFTKISKAIKRDEAHTTHRTRLHTQQYTVCTGYTAAGPNCTTYQSYKRKPAPQDVLLLFATRHAVSPA